MSRYMHSNSNPPTNPVGRILDNTARQDVSDDHDLRAAVHRALAERQRSTATQADDWARPSIDTRRRETPPTLADHEPDTPTRSPKGASVDAPIPIEERRWFREVLKLTAAIIVFGLIGALLVLALRDDTSDVPGEAPPEATPTTLVTPTVTNQTTPTVATVNTDATRQTSRQVAQQALTATAEGAAASATANASLPSPGEVVAVIKVGDGLGGVGGLPVGLATTDGALWVGMSWDRAVNRIDPTTNEVVATIEIADQGTHGGNPYFIASHEDQVWVSAILTDKPLVRIDAATNQVVQTIPLIAADGSDGLAVNGLFVDDTGIWISDNSGGRLLHLDPNTGSVVATIDVPSPRGIVSGFGSLWVASDEPSNASIMRIDATSLSIVETITVPGRVEFIATGAEAVWATDRSSGAVWRIDPSTNSVSAEIDTGLRETRFILVAAGKVWVNGWLGEGNTNGLLTIDPATNALSRFIDTVPGISWWIAELDGSIWATHSDLNEVVRIEPAP